MYLQGVEPDALFLTRAVSGQMILSEEAEICRRKALAYVGKPEARFLLQVARQFDRLEAERRDGRR